MDACKQLDIFEYERLKGMTQCERVIDYMKTHGSISTLEAFNELGITRLASRICDLTRDGYNIERYNDRRKNRFGENVTYKRYRLKEA